MPARLRVLPCSALAALLLTGCVRTRVTRYDPAAHGDRRTPVERIRFFAEQPPTCAYKELARVTSQPGFFGSWDRTVRAARARAHELGGDAIVQINESTRLSGAVWTRGSIETTERTSFSGTVIRFVDPNCRQ